MVKRYVIVQESSDGSGQRGVDALYAGPGGVGWESRHAGMALAALKAWMDEVPPLNETTRLTVAVLDRMPDRARELMALDEERSTRLRAVVEDVDPPVTELWERQALRVPDAVWDDAQREAGK